MIDLLLVNPPKYAYNLMPSFRSQGLDCKVVITPGYADQAAFVQDDGNNISLSSVDSVTTALAFGPNGQRIVEGLNSAGKIVLGNISSPSHFQRRLQHYLADKPSTGAWKFDLVSFKGRHVLAYAKFYNEAYGWKLIDRTKQDLPFFSGRIEEVFEFGDHMGIQNGPWQIYIDNESNFRCRFCFGKESSTGFQKHFEHIWPSVLLHMKEDSKKAAAAFYNWSDRNGSSKRFDVKK